MSLSAVVAALGLVGLAVWPAVAADRPPQDHWQEATDVDKMTDRKTIYMFRIADGEYFKLGNVVERSWPRLLLGCNGPRRFFSVQLTSAVQLDPSGNAQVTTRYGNFRAVTNTWHSETGSDKGLLAPDTMAINNAASLTLVDKFLLRYKSKAGPDVTLEFTTFGVKDHLPKIARACGWDYARAIREAH
jgi:hypothetical protein